MFLENAPPDCKNYSYGLVDRLDSRTRNLDPDTCFKDKRWSRLIRQWNALTQPSSFSSKDSPSTKSPVEVYFSPEDSVERKMIAELDRTLQNPSQSFVYLSANFVTNGALVDKLIELNQQGVHLRLFFDHGRFTDPQFQSQIEKLKTLGFTSGGQNPNEKVTVFHNTLTGSYGCNHNKFAIIGSPNGAVVMNGSANWSKSAMMSNDENIVIFRDPHVATLFAHEFLSQEFVYRYQQNLQAPGFQQDLEKIARLVPCIKESLQGTSCTLATGAQWNFNQTTTAHLISLRQVPANPDSERVWAHVVDARGHTTDIELFTHRVFDGAWVTSVPLPLGVAATMKFFKTPHNTDQNNPVGQAIWEFDGLDRNRSLLPFSLGTAIIRNSYLWGRP
jgi:HKD family nuclease